MRPEVGIELAGGHDLVVASLVGIRGVGAAANSKSGCQPILGVGQFGVSANLGWQPIRDARQFGVAANSGWQAILGGSQFGVSANSGC